MSTAFGFFCTCGASMAGEVQPASRIPELEAIFDGLHQGVGHTRTDQRTARNARRRQEAAERRAWERAHR